MCSAYSTGLSRLIPIEGCEDDSNNVQLCTACVLSASVFASTSSLPRSPVADLKHEKKLLKLRLRKTPDHTPQQQRIYPCAQVVLYPAGLRW